MPQILKPLKFIKSRRPHVYLKDKTIFNETLKAAEIAAKLGDGATLQQIAQQVMAEDNANFKTIIHG